MKKMLAITMAVMLLTAPVAHAAIENNAGFRAWALRGLATTRNWIVKHKYAVGATAALLAAAIIVPKVAPKTYASARNKVGRFTSPLADRVRNLFGQKTPQLLPNDQKETQSATFKTGGQAADANDSGAGVFPDHVVRNSAQFDVLFNELLKKVTPSQSRDVFDAHVKKEVVPFMAQQENPESMMQAVATARVREITLDEGARNCDYAFAPVSSTEAQNVNNMVSWMTELVATYKVASKAQNNDHGLNE